MILIISDPETAISNLGKLKHTIKQKKQIAGILQTDQPQQAPVIRVDNIQNLMLQLHQDAPPAQDKHKIQDTIDVK